MSHQGSFSELEYNQKKRVTQREHFLTEMEAVMPWSSLLSLISAYHLKSGLPSRPPIGLSKMFRIHCMQNWFNYFDRQMEDALYEIESIRRFSGFASV